MAKKLDPKRCKLAVREYDVGTPPIYRDNVAGLRAAKKMAVRRAKNTGYEVRRECPGKTPFVLFRCSPGYRKGSVHCYKPNTPYSKIYGKGDWDTDDYYTR